MIKTKISTNKQSKLELFTHRVNQSPEYRPISLKIDVGNQSIPVFDHHQKFLQGLVRHVDSSHPERKLVGTVLVVVVAQVAYFPLMENPHSKILQKFDEGLTEQSLFLLSFLLEQRYQAEKHVGPDIEVHPALPDHEQKQDEDVPEFWDGGGSAFDEGKEGVPGVEVYETQQEGSAVGRG